MIDPADIELIHNAAPFARLHGKRILLTGGTGFVGTWLQFVPGGVHVTALSHLQYDYGNWDRADWDYIFHLAIVPPGRVIACAKRCGATVFFPSSGSVHDGELSEYAKGKLDSEKRLLDSGLDIRIARLWTFAGAGNNQPTFALANMIYSAIRGEPIRYNVHSTRSYLYAADMAVWLWTILVSGVSGRIYDVGSAKPVRLQHLAREVRKQFPALANIGIEPFEAPDPRPYYVPDTSATRGELGLREYTGFEATIGKTVAYFRRWLEVDDA